MSEEKKYFVSCLGEFMAKMDGFLLCGLEVLEVEHQHQLSFHSGKMYDMLDEHAYLYGFVDTDLVPCQFISSGWSASL